MTQHGGSQFSNTVYKEIIPGLTIFKRFNAVYTYPSTILDINHIVPT